MTGTLDHGPSGSIDSPLPGGDWNLDPKYSEVGFAVKEMWGLRTVRGVFGSCEGTMKVRAGSATGELTIDAASVATGQDRRDRHLRSADFFDVRAHPRITFTAVTVTPRAGGVTVAGELAVGSARVPLAVPAAVEQAANGTLRFKGNATVSRKAAGMPWNILGMIAGDARLHTVLTFRRASSSALSG